MRAAYDSEAPDGKIRKMPAKKVSRVIDVQKNNQLRYNFTGVPETDPRACFNRAIWKEPGSKPTATTIGDIPSDTGGQLGQSALEFEDLLGHHGDGFRRSDYSLVVSDGGTYGSREDPQCNDPG